MLSARTVRATLPEHVIHSTTKMAHDSNQAWVPQRNWDKMIRACIYLSICLSISLSLYLPMIYRSICVYVYLICMYILSNYLNWIWTFTHAYHWLWMEVFGQEMGSVLVTWRSSRIGEGWDLHWWSDLGLRLDQGLKECCWGPTLNLHCQELGSTSSLCPIHW
jgi:hypothetical protein